MRFNHYFSNHFGSCRLLKEMRDPHRERDVSVYALPGEFSCVGITDGIDAWVAPVATGFLEDVRKMLLQIQAGGDPRPVLSKKRGQAAPSPTGRRHISVPEIQNLPNTPAAKIEMTFAKGERRVIRT